METNSLKKSISVKTTVNKAWNELSQINKLSWLEEQTSTKLLSTKNRGVGAVRMISFKDGSNVEEHIVGWMPKKYFSYIATSGLPVDVYHATISISKNENSINIIWESYFSSHGTKSEFMEFTKFLSQFYSRSILNLKNLLEK